MKSLKTILMALIAGLFVFATACSKSDDTSEVDAADVEEATEEVVDDAEEAAEEVVEETEEMAEEVSE